jgi:hypothetical protein
MSSAFAHRQSGASNHAIFLIKENNVTLEREGSADVKEFLSLLGNEPRFAFIAFKPVGEKYAALLWLNWTPTAAQMRAKVIYNNKR